MSETPTNNPQPLSSEETRAVAFAQLETHLYEVGVRPTTPGKPGDLAVRKDFRTTNRGTTSYCEAVLSGKQLTAILEESELGRRMLESGLNFELKFATHVGGYEDKAAAGSQELAKLLNGL